MEPYYQRDGVTLYLGDCREVLPTLESGSVSAMITDPPYGIGFRKYNTHDDSPSDYPELLASVVAESSRLVENGFVFMWQAMKNAYRWPEWFPDGFRIFAALKNFSQVLPTPVQFSWDPVIFWVNGKPSTSSIAGMRDYHVGNTARWVCDKSTKGIHPCKRPLDTVRYIVDLATMPGQLVVDPFFGSGTTGVACAATGVSCVGIEIDEQYAEHAAKRLDRILSEPRLPFIEERPEVQRSLV